MDEAIRRRFRLIPFGVTIPPEERDPKLTAKLKAEWPGILAWMIEGCLEWQKSGLAPPASVTRATDEYLADEDTIGAWIEECCEQSLEHFARTRELYESWKNWAMARSEYVIKEKEIAVRLDGTSFFQIDKLLISLSFVEGEGRLLGTIRVDGEEFEGALLDRGWPGVEGEDVFLVERRGRLDAGIGGEIGEQAFEAVHRQAVVGAAGCLLAPGGIGALGSGDDAGAHRGGGLVIGLVVEHRGEPGTQ